MSDKSQEERVGGLYSFGQRRTQQRFDVFIFTSFPPFSTPSLRVPQSWNGPFPVARPWDTLLSV